MYDYDQAELLIAQKNFKDAYLILKELLRQDSAVPQDVLAYKCAWCLEQLDNTNKEAIAYYQLTIEASANPQLIIESYYHIGSIYYSCEEKQEAGKYFHQTIKTGDCFGLQNQTYYHAMYWYAVCLELEGRYLEAAHYYHLAFGFDSQLEIECRYRKLICDLQVGDYRLAYQECLDFIALADAYREIERYRQLLPLVTREKESLERLDLND